MLEDLLIQRMRKRFGNAVLFHPQSGLRKWSAGELLTRKAGFCCGFRSDRQGKPNTIFEICPLDARPRLAFALALVPAWGLIPPNCQPTQRPVPA
jgi:hypothetical protein